MPNGTVRKGYPYAWKLHYHNVFPVKHRKGLLDPEVIEIIEEASVKISKRYSIEMEDMGYDSDYIQLLCGAHPKIDPDRIVQVFEGSGSF
jgi:putative transposase